MDRATAYAASHARWTEAKATVDSYSGPDKGVERELDAAEVNALLALMVTPSGTPQQRSEKLALFIGRDIAGWRGSQPIIEAILADAEQGIIE